MSLPQDFPRGQSGVHPAIVTGRGGQNDDHPDPTRAGNMQVALAGLHNWGGTISNDDLALSTRATSPTGGDQCIFPGQVDYGTVVEVFHQTGRNDAHIVGMPNETNQAGSSSPGNMNVMQMFNMLFSKNDGRNRPPQYKEQKERGALIRKIVEQGPWFHNLTKGIATHAAFSQIAGNFLPEIKNIPTAIQRHSQIPTEGMMQQLQGAVMSMSSMMQSITSSSSSMKEITKNMPRETADAFQSLALLSQSGQFAHLGGSVTGGRVHEETWKNNAVTLFSQAKTVADLLDSMGRLMHDTSLHGLDQLEDAIFEVETPWGNTIITIDVTGNTSEQLANTTNASMQSFAQTMSQPSGNHTASPGLNMFGGSSGTMFEMAQRLPKEMQQGFKKLMEQINQGGSEPNQYEQRLKQYRGQAPLD